MICLFRKGLKTPWLAYPLIIKSSNINRQKLQIFLERGKQKNNIYRKYIKATNNEKRIYKKVKDAEKNSNNIMKFGILIGCHHGLKEKI